MTTASSQAVGQSAAAPAQPANDKAEISAGDAAARAKDWATALAHYQSATRALPSARAELGAANALYQLGRVGEAYDAYAEAQADFAPQLSTADKTLAAGRLKELGAKTGWLSLRVAEPGANVDLDGQSIGISPVPALVRVATGTHDVRVSKEGFTAFATRVEVIAEGKAIVDVTLVRAETQGHVIVQTRGEPIRVLIDGVDVGATPWQGDLVPGTHVVTGRSSIAEAPAQPVAVVSGATVTVDLIPSSTAAHLQVRTSDGQGQIAIDGVVKGQGTLAADVPAGPHSVVVTRDGYQIYKRTVSLSARETWAETVTLSPRVVAIRTPGLAERATEGVYGGFGLAGLFGLGSQGTELDTHCDTLGAASCQTPSPAGGGLFGYAGWTWNPIGFELMVGGSFDAVRQGASFDGMGRSGNLPLSMPARDETFHFYRAGGVAAVRARAVFPIGPALRGTVAGGLGVSYKQMFMTRRAVVPNGGQDLYAPGSIGYWSPAVTVEASLQVRFTPTLALSVGGLMWADNASIAGSDASPPEAPRKIVDANQVPEPLPTPQYHFASGPQVFIGPLIGLQFGP
jgi:hypothetical protein